MLLRSSIAELRLRRAADWLTARAPAEEVLVVAASADAANELLRTAAIERGGAAFGWHRATLGRLAAALAGPALAEHGLAQAGGLATEAVLARVIHDMAKRGELGRYADVVQGPGFARAIARTVGELRAARIDTAAVAEVSPELATIAKACVAALDDAGLADRARVLELATAAAADAGFRHEWLDKPLLLLDVAVCSIAERRLLASVAARAGEVIATVAAGDRPSALHLATALGCEPTELAAEGDAAGASLARLQRHLFSGPPASPRELDEAQVTVISAPGESRECVEIARRIHQLARPHESGDAAIPFDRMAILLRSVEEYRPHLEEALRRAGIPAHFARGAVRPDPAGRAFMALLACKREALSARRFAEYLSLGEVPRATPAGAPPEAPPPADRWVAPDEELVPEKIADALGEADASPPLEGPAEDDPDAVPVAAGTLRAPRRWEHLLVEAAVIGGDVARWVRRLDGLSNELDRDLEITLAEDAESPRALRVRRQLDDLQSLRGYALPLLETIAKLPPKAFWDEWLDHLSALASRALRHPERVQKVLAELAPMADVGPVDLDEVFLVLAERLLEVAEPPPKGRYGEVYIAPADAARGLAFDVVFVPGLAEKLFPRKIAEEPILLDRLRARLEERAPSEEASSPSHATDAPRRLRINDDRIQSERLALRLAVGAARRHLVLSYPRLDTDQSRPRVPSFYALEALNAATGTLPGFAELASRAETCGAARVGWPAPERAADAIDAAEHDLALLDALMRLDPEKRAGTARYLVEANAHLGRALRFRAKRWRRTWNSADGLVCPSEDGQKALQNQRLSERPYSPTALQTFSLCPYRFFLQAVLRLEPREEPEAIEEMNPLQRGSLVHDVQYELMQRLRAEGVITEQKAIGKGTLARAREVLDEEIEKVAQRYHDELAPAIERVWIDGVAAVKADLREWLRRAAEEEETGFVPWRFELAFGLPRRVAADEHSSPDPVQLDVGVRLRGSIDLVERHPDDGRLRITDHKTGKVRMEETATVAGGQTLQPVLYALTAEKLFPDVLVESGRLYYCTSAGGFEERTVPLDEKARRSAARVISVIRQAVEQAFLPAFPDDGACRWCDYRSVCGPYEERRSRRKQGDNVAPIREMREIP